ncbi:MAG: NAD-dependent epimerase/dehydratase family protein [Bacteroidales bacterium]|nr:NAD-dependent epimerase/dehydratase family protein [Bacteroidales bacterium]
MRVLVTGGAGFIGSHIALKLLEKGYDVTVLDNLLTQIHGVNPELTSPLYCSVKDKTRFIKADVCDRVALEEAISDADFVIHLAAETGTGQSMYEIKRYVDVNIGGTALLLDILTNTKHRVKRVVVAESRAIYGEGKYHCEVCGDVYPTERKDEDMAKGDFECHCPKCGGNVTLMATTEDCAIHPSSVYGIGKQVQGQLVHLICKNIGVESVSFRYQNVYGPGQSLTNPYTGILSIFSSRIKNKKEINIFEDGKESRDFVYIDDVVNATIAGMEVPEANGHVFNIGTGIATDVMTVAKTLCKHYGIEVPLNVSGNYRLGDIRHNFADISLAEKILGFQPQWSFDRGIKQFTEWVNRQELQNDNYEASLEEMKQKGLFK